MTGIRPALVDDLAAVAALLAAERLPTDIAAHLDTLLVACLPGGEVIGAVALEVAGGGGLLRSLVVAPPWRGCGQGARLHDTALDLAISHRLDPLYLLTMSAAGWFIKRGWRPLARDAAPPSIRATLQFSSLCPASAVLMTRPADLAEGGAAL